MGAEHPLQFHVVFEIRIYSKPRIPISGTQCVLLHLETVRADPALEHNLAMPAATAQWKQLGIDWMGRKTYAWGKIYPFAFSLSRPHVAKLGLLPNISWTAQ